MYAVVANGKATIVHSIEQLNNILAIYPYPKWRRCYTEEEALEWLRRNERKRAERDIVNYGYTSNTNGYITVEYFMDGTNIYYNLHTEKVGNILIHPSDDYLVNNRNDMIKIKVLNTVLNDALITHHIIAIQRILLILGDFVDLNITVPDMSVYLALSVYKGKNSFIRNIQQQIEMRIGAVAYTVRSS